MKILFAGSAPFSLPMLEYLCSDGKVDAVLTVPDRQSGRGMHTQKSLVKIAAETHNIPVIQPERLRGEVLDDIGAQGFDLLVCAAYGKIFGPRFLSLFGRGTVNVHPSLLPRYRGAAPIPAAILSGDVLSGITLQEISTEMDCGDLLLQSEYCIEAQDTSKSMIDVLSRQSVGLLATLLEDFDAIRVRKRVQNDADAVYCKKIDTAMGYVQWWESAEHMDRIARALSEPYSGLKVRYKEQVLKVWSTVVVSREEVQAEAGQVLGVDKEYGMLVQAKKGIVGFKILQLPGRKKLEWYEFIQGEKDILKTRFK